MLPAQMKTAAEHFACLLALLAVLCLCHGCEQSDGGPALGVSPSSAVVDVATGSIVLTVGSGTIEGSLPLEWSVSDSSLGRIIRSDGLTATYARLAGNGQNRVMVKDQYGVEGAAVITQVEDASELTTTPTTPTTTTTIPSTLPSSAPSALPSGNRVVVTPFWNDGSSYSTPALPTGATSFTTTVQDSVGHPGETHSLSVTGISWSGSNISAFSAVIDGTTFVTYP